MDRLIRIESNGRGRYVWFYQRYSYVISSRTENKIYFKCRTPECRGTLSTDAQYGHIRPTRVHSGHAVNTREQTVLEFIDNLRRRCRSEWTELSLIFDEEISRRPLDLTRLFSYVEFAPQMNRWRRNTYPIRPRTLTEFAQSLSSHEHRFLGLSLDSGTPFYRGQVNGHSLVFISERLKHLLLPAAHEEREDYVLNIDATFKAVPNLPDAYQMLTVMAPIDGVALPVVYVVMRYKRARCYREVFQEILRQVPGVNPTGIIVDFEAGLHRAIRTVFPNTRIIGCWFHYAQCIVRFKRRRLGLTQEFLDDNVAMKEVIEMAKALPLLPAGDIPAGINYLERHCDNAVAMRPFIEYLRTQWEPKANIVSVFGQKRRTNNEIESYHRHIMKHMGGGIRGGARPPPYKFVLGLQKIERSASNKLGNARSGLRIKWPRHQEYITQDGEVRRAMDGYTEGQAESIENMLQWMRHRAPLAADPRAPEEDNREFEEEEIENFMDGDIENEDEADIDDPLPIDEIPPPGNQLAGAANEDIENEGEADIDDPLPIDEIPPPGNQLAGAANEDIENEGEADIDDPLPIDEIPPPGNQLAGPANEDINNEIEDVLVEGEVVAPPNIQPEGNNEVEDVVEEEGVAPPNIPPGGNQPESGNDEEVRCIICTLNPPNVVSTRCGHISMCEDCRAQILSMNRSYWKCPCCRVRVQNAGELLRVYYL